MDKDAALSMLQSLGKVKTFEFTEDSIEWLIKEAQELSDQLFADDRPHDKLEYVRAHFGSLVARTLMATWRNALGLEKDDLYKSLQAMYTVYEVNKRSSIPVAGFVQHVMPTIVTELEKPDRFTHELDPVKLKDYLKKEFDQGMAKATPEIKEKWGGKYEEHFNSPEGQATYQMATKYLGLMAKIYYLIPKKTTPTNGNA